LSPKQMGPVEHGQPGLPPACSIENLHQGNKVFPFMATAAENPKPIWYQVRKGMYEDEYPYRHQHEYLDKHPELMEKQGIDVPKQRVNAPLYSIWLKPDGKEVRLSYVESRQVYCHFYEHFARSNQEFTHLQDLLANGTDLCIVGYDGKDGEFTMKELHQWYLDPTHPFGHEAVLTTLLLESDPRRYPWRMHQTLDLPGAPVAASL
jgi:hypothetical protein